MYQSQDLYVSVSSCFTIYLFHLSQHRKYFLLVIYSKASLLFSKKQVRLKKKLDQYILVQGKARWQRSRRTRSSSPHRCIKNISRYGTGLTEHWLNTRRRPQTLERARKIHAEPCKTKERREKEEDRKWNSICFQVGVLKKLRSSCIQGNPLVEGQIGWDRRKSSGPVGGE